MRNAVNEFGCFKNGHAIAAVGGGMHGGKCLTSLCPYGMSYNPDSTNTDITKIIGNNCVDVQASKKCTKSIMGQCVDASPSDIFKPKILKNVYFTWFWFPNLSENYLESYINMQLLTCHAMTQGGINGRNVAKIPVTGLCLPGLIWPDKNNLTFLKTGPFLGNDTNRTIFATWLVTAWLENPNLTSTGHTVNPGFLLYISFKDGPWKNIYYDANSGNNKIIINPLTNTSFGKYKNWNTTPGTGSQWVWGAFIHFIINYVAPACKNKMLPANFWLHLDKEGSQSNDAGFTEQMYTNAVANFIGPLITGYKAAPYPILYLATGVDGGAAMAPKENYTGSDTASNCNSVGLTGAWCNKSEPNIGVPEWYWGLGNQMPCDGSEGSYGYARAACTSLSSHRRLTGYPKQYMDLISGGSAGAGAGSSCKTNGWLGLGGLDTAVNNAKKSNVWPSFSVENLSMCDLGDTNCYNRWQYEKTKSGNDSVPLPYTGEWGENTTLCNSMLWGSLLEKGTEFSVKQGMKQCGVFDGFSHWKWKDYVNFLNYFANTYNSPNLITYEASFIPYHWLLILGVTVDPTWRKSFFSTSGNGKQNSARLAVPHSSTPNTSSCPFVNKTGKGAKGCKAVSVNNPASDGQNFCDASCNKTCIITNSKNNCATNEISCGTGGGWEPEPNLQFNSWR